MPPSATRALAALRSCLPVALPVGVAILAIACSGEDAQPNTPPAPPGNNTSGGQAPTTGGTGNVTTGGTGNVTTGGSSNPTTGGTGNVTTGGTGNPTTGGTSAIPAGGTGNTTGGTGNTTGGTGNTTGGTGTGGGNDNGMDTPPTHPLMVNPATAANQKITFTAKQLDPMAGSSTPDTNAGKEESGEVRTNKPVKGKLVMTLGGIGGCCGQGGIGGFAVGLGFHHLVIAMLTTNSALPEEYKKVPEAMRTDEQNRQMGDGRMEAWDGKDRVSWLNINEHDSFAYRAALGLKYMQEQDPGGDWAYFLNADGTVRWSDVYLVGYSYGSQTLAVVGKYVRIGRGIATSGPVDEGFPNATWIKAPSATPLERMIGLYGSGNLDTKVQTASAAGWLAPAVTVAGNVTTDGLMNGHQFILEGEGHGEFCAGDGGKWKALCAYAFGAPL